MNPERVSASDRGIPMNLMNFVLRGLYLLSILYRRLVFRLWYKLLRTAAVAMGIALALLLVPKGFADDPPLKQHSAFYTPEQLAAIRTNINKTPWTKTLRATIVSNATPWMSVSDEELWDSMFGATIPRSWMVWSNGHCPACKKGVEMYAWKHDAWKYPWKVQCPHCSEFFPKNDFHAFYKSGLDEHGVFDPKKADRKLLFNVEHPEPNDPLNKFGVDDGEGYVEGGNRWRFIGFYLIFGQFHEKIISGIDTLAAAYVLTGDPVYAHKAAILLDRVADVYPTFDFMQQGYVYEIKQASGYVSVWHDTSEETYEMVLAYDQIFEGIRNDAALTEFLSKQAEKYKLPNPKRTFADVQRNIETRILRDALAHPEKIHSNFPRRECTEAAILTVLAWPENRSEVEKRIDTFLAKATAVDGVTGEKGLAGYSAYVIATVARFLNEYTRVDPTFLSEVMKRNPGLRQTYRFHIDTQCLGKFYPIIGDTLSFSQKQERNPVMQFSTFRPGLRTPLAPSMTSFYWKLYQETSDPAYAQAVYIENHRSVTNIPYDIFEKDPAAVQRGLKKVIAKYGPEPQVGSINKKQWHLAILRSGNGENERALWMDYDAWGAHGHQDGLNLGLFANGIDLLPDFGYPTVQFGGWTTPRALWYKMNAAHNTVVVNGQPQPEGAGATTLWADGKSFRAMRASAPALNGGKQFERTAALVDISDREFYVVDVFRVAGGSDHAKFIHSHFGTITNEGISPQQTLEYGYGTQTRGFKVDTNPTPGWSVTWQVNDRLKLLRKGQKLNFRYTDLTTGSEAWTGEAWIVPTIYYGTDGVWNPCVISRHRGAAPLATTFVGILEPFESKSLITKTRRLPLRDGLGQALPDSEVAIEIQLRNGSRDLIIAADPARIQAKDILVQPDWNVTLAGELAFIRKDAKGRLQRVALGCGSSLQVASAAVENADPANFVEADFTGSKPRVVVGDIAGVKTRK